MAKKSVVVAVAQMRVTGDLGTNLREIAAFVEMARLARAGMVCFPECALTGYGPAHHKSAADFDPDAVAAALVEVRAAARDSGLAVIMGAHLPVNGAWTNTVMLLDGRGRLLTRYDKAHLYGLDPEFYRAGRARPEVATAKRVRVGLQICFDIRFPEPFRHLALAGAHAIFVPSFIHGLKGMWKNPVIASHVASRAAENGRYVVFANAAGREQNVPSMIANPRGEIVARCRKGASQLLTLRLDLGHVNDEFLLCRRTDLYPPPGRKRR